MATNGITPPPPPSQPFTDRNGKNDSSWWKWLSRLQAQLVEFLPPLGAANQILGVNAGGTANEYKTLTQGNGITIANAPGVITITVKQMQLGDVLAFAARHG